MNVPASLIKNRTSLPSIFIARPAARTRLRDFFSAHLRNPNTRRAYRQAVQQFSTFCGEHGIADLAQIEPVHVAAFVETQLKQHSTSTVKLAGDSPADGRARVSADDRASQKATIPQHGPSLKRD